MPDAASAAPNVTSGTWLAVTPVSVSVAAYGYAAYVLSLLHADAATLTFWKISACAYPLCEWLAAAKSPGFLPLSFCLPVVPSNATRLPETGDETFSTYPLCVWLAAAKSPGFLPLSFCLPVVPSNATRLPETGDETFSVFPLFRAVMLSCIAF